MYIKYKLQKKQVSHDGGVTWVDVVPLEERVGDSAGTYSTLEECEADYSSQYLTIESLEDGNIIYWYGGNSGFTRTISASTDNGQTWTAYTATSGGTQMITLNTGDKVFIKGLNDIYFPEVYTGYYTSAGGCRFRPSKRHIVYGNIMSLVDGDNFIGSTSMESRSFRYLFYGDRMLISTENLILPATTLSQYCYQGMFGLCTSLAATPELPATTLAEYCYNAMFAYCANLTIAPVLSATTLAAACYWGMFNDCTSLTVAPELPATTLVRSCYNDMFKGCTSLTTVPELPATTLASQCYNSMFKDCTNLTIAPELPATTLAYYCYSNMFDGCTSLTTAPELPATTLAYGCYGYMFYNCTSLTTAPQLSATTLVDGCYQYMFAGCSSLNYIKCLATDISATQSTVYWLNGVASTGTFVKASNMTGWTTGTNGIPNNWTVQNA